MNITTEVWKSKLVQCLNSYDHIVHPRGMEVREVVNGHYTVPMPAYIELANRKVNVPFMLREAAWIISGSNRLEDLTPFIPRYADFSDDGKFLKGAYGPKVIDQLPYVVDAIAGDVDTRQAVLTIWRERPGPSRDIPCTVAMQFLVRDDKLHSVVTMRSQDIVLGFTFDVFTFSMVAKAVQLLLLERGIEVELGDLHVNAGSMHLYSDFYERAQGWVEANIVDGNTGDTVHRVLEGVSTYTELVNKLIIEAERLRRNKNG